MRKLSVLVTTLALLALAACGSPAHKAGSNASQQVDVSGNAAPHASGDLCRRLAGIKPEVEAMFGGPLVDSDLGASSTGCIWANQVYELQLYIGPTADIQRVIPKEILGPGPCPGSQGAIYGNSNRYVIAPVCQRDATTFMAYGTILQILPLTALDQSKLTATVRLMFAHAG